MVFPKKGVRVFLPGARVGEHGIENGATERNSGRGRMSRRGGLWREGEEDGGLLGFLMEMRLPPPPVASSWHVPPNLNALAPLDDDAHIDVIRSRILRHRNDVICNSCKLWKIFLLWIFDSKTIFTSKLANATNYINYVTFLEHV